MHKQDPLSSAQHLQVYLYYVHYMDILSLLSTYHLQTEEMWEKMQNFADRSAKARLRASPEEA